MDKTLLELFEPAFVVNVLGGTIVDINYSFGSLAGLSPRKIRRKAPPISEVFKKTSAQLSSIISEALENEDTTLTGELNEILNNEQVTYVSKVIPMAENQVVVLLNNLTVENILHKKYNILVESSVHIHRKIFDSYYMMSRIPVTVPAALSHPFRDGLNSLVSLKKYLSPGKETQKKFDIVKNAFVRISGVSLNVQYLLPTISHKEQLLTFKELFTKYVLPRVDRVKDSYLNSIEVEYDLSSKVLDKDFAMDPAKLADAIVNILSNSLESVYETCMSDKPRVVLEAYLMGEEIAEFVCINIIDNGMHITSDTKKKMFAPFFSGFSDVSLGLGLTNSKRCIEDHGGDVRFMDAYIDGNQFQVRLPLSEHMTLNQIKSPYRRVFLLTEDIDTRLVLNNYLKGIGIDYKCFFSKKEFIESIVDLENKDCLIVEYDKSYEEFLAKLKKKKAGISIILLLKIQQYSSFLALNEKIRIKDVIIYPPTYDLVLKSLLR